MTDIRADSELSFRKRLKAAHFAWAALAIIVSVALALAPQRGHPPPLVLVPLVLLAWPIGHVLLWGGGWLADQGRRRAAGTATSPRKWPAVLIIALLGTGAGSIMGLLQLLGSGLRGRWYPYPEPALWTGMLVVWLVHAVCLVGLLLRNPWARLLSAALALGWAVLLSAQVAEHIDSASRTDLGELLLAIGLVVLLVVLAGRLVVSSAVKSFFHR